MKCTKCGIEGDDYGIKMTQKTPTECLCPKCLKETTINLSLMNSKPLSRRIREYAEIMRYSSVDWERFAVKVEAMDADTQSQLAPMFFAYLQGTRFGDRFDG